MSLTTLLIALLAGTGIDGSQSGDARLKLLDFHTPRCAPCLAMRPEIAQLIDAGYPIRSIDRPEEPEVAQKYNVDKFPTFIIVDPEGRELSRVLGFQPAAQLARHYNDVCRRWKAEQGQTADAQPVQPSEAEDTETASDSSAASGSDAEKSSNGNLRRVSAGDGETVGQDGTEMETPTAPKPPKPWETVVRIQVHDANSIGFGSGTIIYSDSRKSLILTCAHIFKIKTPLPPNPARFPRRVTVDLFDGRLHGLKPAQVHKLRTVEAKVIDYDFVKDVGLIEIQPKSKLAASPIVGPDWRPRKGLAMDTVGCSHGNDATAWTTEITSPNFRGQIEGRVFEGTACLYSPKTGRSGGGLFTRDGYLAGVCDFATDDNHGLYASPHSIYKLLDRNQLTALYQPSANASDSNRTLLAADDVDDDRESDRGRTVRGQSPDSVERRSPVQVALPDPHLLGIRSPSKLNRNAPKTASNADQAKGVWRSLPPEPADSIDPEARGGRRNPIAARINMDPSARDERAETSSAPAPSSSSRKPSGSSTGTKAKTGWQSADEPFPEFAGVR